MESNIIACTPLNDFFVPLEGPIIATFFMGKNPLDTIFASDALKNITHFTLSYHQRLTKSRCVLSKVCKTITNERPVSTRGEILLPIFWFNDIKR